MLKTTASKSTTIKVLASTVLVGGAVAVAGLGTFGAFTSTTTAQQDVAAGTITLTLNGKTAATPIPLDGMVPGDHFQRAFNLARGAGDELFGSLTIDSNVTGDAGLVGAFDAVLKTCDAPWVPSATASKDLTCASGERELANVTDVAQDLPLPAGILDSTLNGTSRQLNLAAFYTFTDQGEITDNALKGKKATIDYTFTATQRGGTAR
ncbi:TasA family protein [Nocardioides pacificus]